MSTITKGNLHGQRALVTGATSGIGRAVSPAPPSAPTADAERSSKGIITTDIGGGS
jgi:hypothetical protein